MATHFCSLHWLPSIRIVVSFNRLYSFHVGGRRRQRRWQRRLAPVCILLIASGQQQQQQQPTNNSKICHQTMSIRFDCII